LRRPQACGTLVMRAAASPRPFLAGWPDPARLGQPGHDPVRLALSRPGIIEVTQASERGEDFGY
jgi:hypothetical protein